jgi:predicted trehalose synthase
MTDKQTPPDWVLIEAARDSGHELAIALGERLEELESCADELADAIAEARELSERVDSLRDELQAFHDAEETGE